MRLTSVGFFKDLPYGNESENRLADSVSKFSGEGYAEAISYLKSGVPFVVAPGLSKDRISGKFEIIGPLILLTDGKYVWPSDLAYYLERYRVELPNDFLCHMRDNNWKIPPVDIDGLEM